MHQQSFSLPAKMWNLVCTVSLSEGRLAGLQGGLQAGWDFGAQGHAGALPHMLFAGRLDRLKGQS